MMKCWESIVACSRTWQSNCKIYFNWIHEKSNARIVPKSFSSE